MAVEAPAMKLKLMRERKNVEKEEKTEKKVQFCKSDFETLNLAQWRMQHGFFWSPELHLPIFCNDLSVFSVSKW